jgi:hypothetical protein
MMMMMMLLDLLWTYCRPSVDLPFISWRLLDIIWLASGSSLQKIDAMPQAAATTDMLIGVLCFPCYNSSCHAMWTACPWELTDM